MNSRRTLLKTTSGRPRRDPSAVRAAVGKARKRRVLKRVVPRVGKPKGVANLTGTHQEVAALEAVAVPERKQSP